MMNHTPPPFFKQGPSAHMRLCVFALLALVLLVLDARSGWLKQVRQGVAVLLYPIQHAVLLPRDGVRGVGQYFRALEVAQQENQQLRQQLLQQAQQAQTNQQLTEENGQLRRLLGAREGLKSPSALVEILYEMQDPFTRKLMVDKGLIDGIQPGQPVIDDQGVVGQVTRSFVKTAEITLLPDRDQAIPVQIVRNGLRSVAYGSETPGLLDLRFLASNADVQQGDLIVTSGIDGLYPAGLPVAKIVHIERSAAQSFARISCAPIGGVSKHRHLLVLQVKNDFPAPSGRYPEVIRQQKSRHRQSERGAEE
ncbi:rod shape-determining protein MreC [Parvibium lacunae]|uniref:Cell shape-determining protein MreC n=1 Tax=Parvibium lacunae TaxID=1888893 RepID=A0A368L4T5_9BURK|nr:rod shape-determining protein MreC [Parvibium lacunae]RCS58598.1 rod shape-determining protein MreC [Parvibium lacunae]